MDKDEIYLTLYKENREHGRHHESQRTTMSNLILIITAGIGSIISLDKTLSNYDLPLSIFIIILGTFGIIFTLKYGSRLSYHWSVAIEILNQLSPEVKATLDTTRKNAETGNKYPKWIREFTITQYWVMLHSLIVLIGIVLTTMILSDTGFKNKLTKNSTINVIQEGYSMKFRGTGKFVQEKIK